MTNRRKLLLLAPTGVLAAGLLGAAWWSEDRSAAEERQVAKPVSRPDDKQAAAIGGPFQLEAAGGRIVTDQDFRGKWMLVYFGFTHCPDACPTALQAMANAVDELGPEEAKQVAIVFITVDPARDTPALMHDYVSAFQAPIAALSGTSEQIAAAAKAYRVYYSKHDQGDGEYSMDHSSIIYVMDPNGKFAANFTHQTSPDQIAARMRKLIG